MRLSMTRVGRQAIMDSLSGGSPSAFQDRSIDATPRWISSLRSRPDLSLGAKHD